MSTEQSGPPYAPEVASVGGQATPIPDVPILGVLLALYVGSAAGHMTLFQLNRSKGHTFIISAALFGFSMSRILTCSLRIGSAYHPNNISLLIAASIFVNAGILIAYIVNIHFGLRILRARQPRLGWHPVFRYSFRIIYVLVLVALVLVIVFTVLSFYTLDTDLRTVSRDVQLACITFFLVVAALPLLLLVLTFILPRDGETIRFGTGSMATKVFVLTVSATLCTLGAGFKTGAQWQHPRPIDDPAWYQSKACFYVFYFALEILVLYFLLFMRVDKRFYVPDGSSKRGTLAAPGNGGKQTGETAFEHDEDV